MLDPDRLLAYPIPEVRHRVTPKDVVLYALGVGLGQDPMDTHQLDFVDPHRSLRALPTMAAVLAHPGFWLADPATTVDAEQLVHGEQSLVLHGPLPTDGLVVGRTAITGLIYKGPGRGALLYTEKTLHDEAGTLLAEAHSTTVLRADGGFGRTLGVVRPPHPAPQGSPSFTIDLPTRPEQALLYRLSGDDNPLHAAPDAAARAGFPRPILHGLCTMGVVGHALLRATGYDAAGLRTMALRFAAPVYPGETIRTEIWPDGAFQARVLERDILVVSNGHARFDRRLTPPR